MGGGNQLVGFDENGKTTPVSGDFIPKSGGDLTGDIEFAVDGQSMGGLHAAQGKYMHLMQSPSTSSPGSALFFPINKHTSDEAWAIQIAGVADPSFNHDAANKRYVDRAIVRQNLLDNWYFANPVNQRGQTEYTTEGYSIDRWRVYDSSHLVVNDGYITLKAGLYFNQIIRPEVAKMLLGKTITGTTLSANWSLRTGIVTLPTAIPSSPTNYTFFVADGYNFYIRIYADGVIAAAFNVGSNTEVGLIAVKLELGPIQTLAHQENDVWVLNEIPDYATELLKCQKYYIGNDLLAVPLTYTGENAYCVLFTQIPMRTKPSLNGTPTTALIANNASVETTVYVDRASDNCVVLLCAASGLVYMYGNNLGLSADL